MWKFWQHDPAWFRRLTATPGRESLVWLTPILLGVAAFFITTAIVGPSAPAVGNAPGPSLSPAHRASPTGPSQQAEHPRTYVTPKTSGGHSGGTSTTTASPSPSWTSPSPSWSPTPTDTGSASPSYTSPSSTPSPSTSAPASSSPPATTSTAPTTTSTSVSPDPGAS